MKLTGALFLMVVAALLTLAATTPPTLTPVPCPAGFNCSYTYTATWPPTTAMTVTINWYKTLGGPIDHTRTVQNVKSSVAFEVEGGLWYVQLFVVPIDGSLAPASVIYQVQYPGTLIPIMSPGVPTNLQAT